MRTHFPLRVQGPALRTVPISPAFQEVCQHLTLALDADLASAQEVVRTLPQQPVDLLCHLRGRKGRQSVAGPLLLPWSLWSLAEKDANLLREPRDWDGPQRGQAWESCLRLALDQQERAALTTGRAQSGGGARWAPHRPQHRLGCEPLQPGLSAPTGTQDILRSGAGGCHLCWGVDSREQNTRPPARSWHGALISNIQGPVVPLGPSLGPPARRVVGTSPRESRA